MYDFPENAFEVQDPMVKTLYFQNLESKYLENENRFFNSIKSLHNLKFIALIMKYIGKSYLPTKTDITSVLLMEMTPNFQKKLNFIHIKIPIKTHERGQPGPTEMKCI